MLKKTIWKFSPILILVILFFLFFYFKIYRYLSFSMLQADRTLLISWVSQHFLLASLAFIGIYILFVAISLPNAMILTLLSGFLFGPVFGTIYVVFSATIGACLIFLAAKTALHDLLYEKSKNWLRKLSEGFNKNAVNYLLFLRFVPIFPFWLINIAPAFLNVCLRTFFWTTLIGIIPGSFVYVLLGNGLGLIFDQGRKPNLSLIFDTRILVPILALAILSLVPILYKRFAKHGKVKN